MRGRQASRSRHAARRASSPASEDLDHRRGVLGELYGRRPRLGLTEDGAGYRLALSSPSHHGATHEFVIRLTNCLTKPIEESSLCRTCQHCASVPECPGSGTREGEDYRIPGVLDANRVTVFMPQEVCSLEDTFHLAHDVGLERQTHSSTGASSTASVRVRPWRIVARSVCTSVDADPR